MLRRFLVEEARATAIEYGLIASLVAGFIISSLLAPGSSLDHRLDELGNAICGGCS